MADRQWFVIKSSHALKLVSRGGAPKALCGKWGSPLAPMHAELPMGIKSCETCARLVIHDEERSGNL